MWKRFVIVTIFTISLPFAFGIRSQAQSAPAVQKQSRHFPASSVPTQYVSTGMVRYAYRVFGSPTGLPLLLINRFRGTLDDWDPALLDTLAAERRIIAFDNAGFAGSTGEAPRTLAGLARDTATFIEALGIKQIDVLGFSYGGYTAQELALDRPDLVRRLVLASSGPGFVEDTPTNPEVNKVASKPINSEADLLYLFFKNTSTSRTAGTAYLERVSRRNQDRDKPVAPAAVMAQLSASNDIGKADTSFLTKSAGFSIPVLIAHGSSDVLIPMQRAYTLFRALPDAKLIIYPNAGHGFLFQYPNQFAHEVLEFLRNN